MCEYCEQRLNLNSYEEYCDFDNQIEIASGGWTLLYMGLNKNSEYVLRACGDGETEDCLINFCPMCGRNLREQNNDK